MRQRYSLCCPPNNGPAHAGAAGALQLGASMLGVQLHGDAAGSGASAGAAHHDTDWRPLVGLVTTEVDAAGHELLEAVCAVATRASSNAATVVGAAAAMQPT
jgi:uncharacterized protein YgfB (UPF0149 family)